MTSPLALLFPPRCAICGEVLPFGSKEKVCRSCEDELPRMRRPRCEICSCELRGPYALPLCPECIDGRPFVRCFVPFRYTGKLRSAVLRMKLFGRASAARYFAAEIYSEMKGFKPDFITFVPQSRKTLLERGYNNTRLIAEELGRLVGVPVKSTLIHVENGVRQLGLGESVRRKNAKKLFKAGKKHLCGTALIVDDVMTTGSTIDACCRLLRSMGCERVYAAVAAKNMKNS